MLESVTVRPVVSMTGSDDRAEGSWKSAISTNPLPRGKHTINSLMPVRVITVADSRKRFFSPRGRSPLRACHSGTLRNSAPTSTPRALASFTRLRTVRFARPASTRCRYGGDTFSLSASASWVHPRSFLNSATRLPTNFVAASGVVGTGAPRSGNARPRTTYLEVLGWAKTQRS